MANINVVVQDANNVQLNLTPAASTTAIIDGGNQVTLELTPTPTQVISLDRGVAGNGIESISAIDIDGSEYLHIVFTNGTTSDVGPIATSTYFGTSPIVVTGDTISLSTVPLTLGGTGATTAAAARTNLGLGSIATQNANSIAVTGGSITGIIDLAIADGGTGASTAADARTNLGLGTAATTNASAYATAAQGAKADTAVQPSDLGTIASQNANSVLITGGSITGITDLAVADGGTGASTAANARTNLGLGSAAVLTAGAALGAATLDAGGTIPLSQIPASIQGGVSYQGSWNATTNSPTLTSSVGSKGYYYVVSTAGSTNLNGVTDWNIGDWAIFNGTVWQKIDNTDAVTSVNGYTGTVVLTNTDISGLGTMSTQNANAVAITGGAIDGTTIGGTTPAVITGSTVNANTKVVSPDFYAQSVLGGNLRTYTGTSLLNWDGGGSGNVTVNGGLTATPANKNVTLSPTGTGTVTINPATASSMDNVAIGGTISAAATFTTLTATGQTSLGGVSGAEAAKFQTASTAGITYNSPWIFRGGQSGVSGAVLTSSISARIQTGDASPFTFATNAGTTGAGSGSTQAVIAHTSSAVNYVQVTGSATGSAVAISGQGSDSTVGVNISTKGNSAINFFTGSSTRAFAVFGGTSTVNALTVSGGAAGSGPTVGVNGSDTNIDLTLTPKGTGVLKTTAVANIGAGTVLAGATNPLVAMTGNTNQYVQSYIVNNNAGASASADFVAYANNSTDAHGWADMGFTSSVYADATYTVTGPNEAYLFGSALNSSYTGNLVYATDSTGSANAHQWYVGGFTQAKSAWKMQLTSTGLQLASALGVAYGGTGSTTLTANSVLLGNGTSALQAVAPGTTGNVLTSNGTTWVSQAASGGGATITDDTTTNATYYPLVSTATSGSLTAVKVSSSKYTYNPSTGTLTATTVTGSSDERLKSNWASVSDDFIEQLSKVKHGTYDHVDSNSRQVGASAQGIQSFLPEGTDTDANGMLSLNYGGVALVAAIKLSERLILAESKIEQLIKLLEKK